MYINIFEDSLYKSINIQLKNSSFYIYTKSLKMEVYRKRIIENSFKKSDCDELSCGAYCLYHDGFSANLYELTLLPDKKVSKRLITVIDFYYGETLPDVNFNPEEKLRHNFNGISIQGSANPSSHVDEVHCKINSSDNTVYVLDDSTDPEFIKDKRYRHSANLSKKKQDRSKISKKGQQNRKNNMLKECFTLHED